MFDLLIKNAKIVSGQGITDGNLYIKDGKIAAVSTELLTEETAKEIDAAGKFVMPGVVDEHVHIIDMGQRELGRYELDSGSAAVGGITTVLEMPLSNPPSTSLASFKQKEERAAKNFVVDYGLYGGAVPGNLDEMYK
ncbi:MAG: allantoinase AllB, partial [Emergencia timonensis]